VTATDASGRSTSGVLRITVIARTAAPTKVRCNSVSTRLLCKRY
jgi:hypothetical protein